MPSADRFRDQTGGPFHVCPLSLDYRVEVLVERIEVLLSQSHDQYPTSSALARASWLNSAAPGRLMLIHTCGVFPRRSMPSM